MAIGASFATRLALIVPVAVLAGCASAGRSSTVTPEPASALASRACTEIMGLRPGAEHVACSGSLARYGELLQPDAAVAESTSGSLLPELPVKFHGHMNQHEQRQRAELSCVQIGLLPGWPSFGGCVHGLNYAIADVRNWPGP